MTSKTFSEIDSIYFNGFSDLRYLIPPKLRLLQVQVQLPSQKLLKNVKIAVSLAHSNANVIETQIMIIFFCKISLWTDQ